MEVYSINKSRFGYDYQYKYALLTILKSMLAGRLKRAWVDYPFSSGGNINLSLDIRIELMNPNEYCIYEVKTGDNFKRDNIEGLKGVLRSLYHYTQGNKKISYKVFIIISPDAESMIYEYWNDFQFIQTGGRANLHGEAKNDVLGRLFGQFDFGVKKTDFAKLLRQMTFKIGPSYQNDSQSDKLSDLEDQIKSEIENFCIELSLRDSEIEIPAWSIVLELLEVLNKCSESNKEAAQYVFKKLRDCMYRKGLLKEVKYEQGKERILGGIKEGIDDQLASITGLKPPEESFQYSKDHE